MFTNTCSVQREQWDLHPPPSALPFSVLWPNSAFWARCRSNELLPRQPEMAGQLKGPSVICAAQVQLAGGGQSRGKASLWGKGKGKERRFAAAVFQPTFKKFAVTVPAPQPGMADTGRAEAGQKPVAAKRQALAPWHRAAGPWFRAEDPTKREAVYDSWWCAKDYAASGFIL